MRRKPVLIKWIHFEWIGDHSSIQGDEKIQSDMRKGAIVNCCVSTDSSLPKWSVHYACATDLQIEMIRSLDFESIHQLIKHMLLKYQSSISQPVMFSGTSMLMFSIRWFDSSTFSRFRADLFLFSSRSALAAAFSFLSGFYSTFAFRDPRYGSKASKLANLCKASLSRILCCFYQSLVTIFLFGLGTIFTDLFRIFLSFLSFSPIVVGLISIMFF